MIYKISLNLIEVFEFLKQNILSIENSQVTKNNKIDQLMKIGD